MVLRSHENPKLLHYGSQKLCLRAPKTNHVWIPSGWLHPAALGYKSVGAGWEKGHDYA